MTFIKTIFCGKDLAKLKWGDKLVHSGLSLPKMKKLINHIWTTTELK